MSVRAVLFHKFRGLGGALSTVSMAIVAIAGGTVPPAHAQSGEIVQPIARTDIVERLNDNLARLSRQPTDMDALIGAGMAAYELGDIQAANGFFTRANLVNDRDGRAHLGLALVSLQLKDPRAAAAHFDAAAQFGADIGPNLFDRAMAYDLVGQQAKAQLDYAAALRAKPGDRDIVRAYAVSLGISGHLPEAEAMIRPLLYRSDRAAWRDRTMILAMNGRTADARRIAQSVMPRALADALDPYLQHMSGLTPAQKAAATFYGQFPADGLRTPPASSVTPTQVAARDDHTASSRKKKKRGADDIPATEPALTDDSRLLAAMPHGDTPPEAEPVPPRNVPAIAAVAPARPQVASISNGDEPDVEVADAAQTRPATKRGKLPQATATSPAGNGNDPGRAGPPTPTATGPVLASAQETRSVGAVGIAPAKPVPTPAAPASVPEPTRIAAAETPRPGFSGAAGLSAGAPGAASATSPVATPQAPLAASVAADAVVPIATQPSGAIVPGSGATPTVQTPQTRSLSDIMSEIQVPDAERQGTVAPVDLAEVARFQAEKRKAAEAAAAAKAKKEAEAAAKAAAAAKAKAEAEEKARIKANPSRYWVQVATGRGVDALAFDFRRLRKTYTPIAGLSGYTAEWGQTRRLLVGPFPTSAKAKALESDLKKAGADCFVWQSDAGEVVDMLSGK